jgi:hypothetical protein
MRGFSQGTSATLWRNRDKLAAFDHELIQAVAGNVNARESARFDSDFCALIHIKAASGGGLNSFDCEKGGCAMPTETAIVVAGVVLMFAAFVIALAWAAYYTRNTLAPGAKDFRAPPAKE